MSLSTLLQSRVNELEMSISDLARRSGVSRADEPDDYFDGEPHDGTCVVRNSGWIPRIANESSRRLSPAFDHLCCALVHRILRVLPSNHLNTPTPSG